MLFDCKDADFFCQDEKWQELDGDDGAQTSSDNNINNSYHHDDDDDEDEELESLFCKEKETSIKHVNTEPIFHSLRNKTVEWIVRVNAHYGFSALTAVLAVNYLDRFVSILSLQRDKKPWMMQLAAVACLSLAAKVEETHVPLLLDLQVGDTEYVFEAKTIQRMELLVLSSLQWRMNPVTPLSFLDHVIRRLGLKSYCIHLEFLKRCENLLLFIISDARFARYLPSVLATATMLHVIHGVEPSCNGAIDYENQLLGVLNKVSKEEVDDCYELIMDILSRTSSQGRNNHPLKRKNWQDPSSPSGVVDATFSSDDSSNDSWGVQLVHPSSSSSSPSSFNNSKKRRVQEQQMKRCHL